MHGKHRRNGRHVLGAGVGAHRAGIGLYSMSLGSLCWTRALSITVCFSEDLLA